VSDVGWLLNRLSEVREVIELAAHPKFTTVDGNIVYYLTKSDVEAARALYEKLAIK
jgi:glycerol kinase